MARERHYGPSEANAMIRPLTALLVELRAARAVLVDRDLVTTLAERAPGNGGGTEGSRFAEAALRFSRGLGRLDAWGVVVRDLEQGICDFPARRGGREVFLCWRDGEEQVAYWHEPDAGFAGRRPLDDAVEGE